MRYYRVDMTNIRLVAALINEIITISIDEDTVIHIGIARK